MIKIFKARYEDADKPFIRMDNGFFIIGPLAIRVKNA